MQQINISEFKAVCLRLLEEVRQTGEPIEILKNGEPLAIVTPSFSKSRKAAFGSMRPRLEIKRDEDLVTPLASEDWEALKH